MLYIIQILGKPLKMFCFGFIPLILLAGASKRDFEKLRLDKGTCSFNIDGKLSFHLNGVANFQNKTEVDKFGNKTDKLLLIFNTCDDKKIQTLEFVIASKAKGSQGLPEGKYKIKNLNRLMNNFSGVYGFADLREVSELPFFIKSGDIIITESFSNKVDGKLEVQLQNAEGELLNVKGSFNAAVKV
ncbi:hypothetical protein [Maribacter ulvicola]|uniref:YceI-like domain-containing protein n=1 Tax=Maribacter ulvicola TaxID=228959 RepID=A0A1N6PX26_9FLAO|nr:hypothetical protein [Maribacter ulvicola]SIQ08881.1 hypothetical protein SAMN05421797_101631 [Maribacter ulvicola]